MKINRHAGRKLKEAWLMNWLCPIKKSLNELDKGGEM